MTSINAVKLQLFALCRCCLVGLAAQRAMLCTLVGEPMLACLDRAVMHDVNYLSSTGSVSQRPFTTGCVHMHAWYYAAVAATWCS